MSVHSLAILVSGTGRHLANLARLCEAGELDARIALVISDREGVRALDLAREHGLEALVLDPRREQDLHAFSERAFHEIEARGCDTVVMAGFLRKLEIPARWTGRVLNIHPALLPAFGGKGFWGERVHRAVLEQRCPTSGCTVHYADAEYDHGPILLQRSVPVLPADDVHSLAARVFAEELIALPEALRLHWK